MKGIRLKQLREEKGLKQEELALALSVSPSAIGMYERDYREPSDGLLIKMAIFFEVSTDFLLGKTDTRNNTDIDIKDKKIHMLPVYGRIAAGQPNWAEECIEGRIPVDPDLMDIVNPDECYFLRVNGESMNKEIKNGAYALIRKTDVVDDGEIAVVLVNGYDATLKRFTRQGDFVILEPMSNDPSFTTQIYGKDTEIKIIGKYIGKMEMK